MAFVFGGSNGDWQSSVVETYVLQDFYLQKGTHCIL
jgi:hypothetical protein